ncbi:MAG: hypothetical protein ABEJ76_00895 [Halanaeroarchaeum sp.]
MTARTTLLVVAALAVAGIGLAGTVAAHGEQTRTPPDAPWGDHWNETWANGSANATWWGPHPSPWSAPTDAGRFPGTYGQMGAYGGPMMGHYGSPMMGPYGGPMMGHYGSPMMGPYGGNARGYGGFWGPMGGYGTMPRAGTAPNGSWPQRTDTVAGDTADDRSR